MMKGAKESVLGAIGDTPIVKLNVVTKGVASEIYVKLEYTNPGGSVKDRLGYYLCKKAVEAGKLKPGGVIIESTSGNTGVGVAMFAAIHGYKAVFVMADKQSEEKRNNLRNYGAEVVICPTNVEPTDPRSYYSVARLLSQTIPNSIYLNQYDNPANFQCHYEWTGPEIYQQTQGDFDVYMATVGTGGTISGTGAYLKEKMPNLKVIGVDPVGSILAHYKKTGEIIPGGSYLLEGFGEDFLPENVKFDVIDDFVIVEDRESFEMTRRLLLEEAIWAGGSSGSVVVGAIRYAQKLKNPERILCIIADSGNRYTSKIYNDQWMQSKGFSIAAAHPIKNQIQDILKSKGVQL